MTIGGGCERFLGDDDIIVSKTDSKGRLTYVNRTFMTIADYSESELLGQPHNIIRHPDMPRAIFRLLWDRIKAGEEIFAYVKNRTKGGGFYWVLAHVTPSFDDSGAITGYHSNRRAPDRPVIAEISELYAALCAIEREGDRKAGLESSFEALHHKMAARGLDYDRYVFSTVNQGRAA
ncbi:MAG: PAS domain S-box protein [Rhodothalassiaceae bacterium]